MGVVFSRLLQAVRLQRDAFVWMDFNDRATGDAAILVAITQVLIALGTGTSLLRLLNPATLISLMLSALFFWVFYSGAVYVISRFLFDGSGGYAIYLRVTGFAYPTLLLVVFAVLVIESAAIALVLGGAWFVVVVANGLLYTVDLPMLKAVTAAVGGLILLVIIQAIFGSLLAF